MKRSSLTILSPRLDPMLRSWDEKTETYKELHFFLGDKYYVYDDAQQLLQEKAMMKEEALYQERLKLILQY